MEGSMADNSIGIKLANGDFFPILDAESPSAKRLTVTTANDNQASAQIDLFRGPGVDIKSANYIGSLVIENISPMPKGDPEISLELRLDDQGNLKVNGSEASSGESQQLLLSLSDIDRNHVYEIPDFNLGEITIPDMENISEDLSSNLHPEKNPFEKSGDIPSAKDESEEDLYSSLTDSKESVLKTKSIKNGRNTKLSVILFVIAGFVLATIFGFLIYFLINMPKTKSPVVIPETTLPVPDSSKELPKPAETQTKPTETQTTPVVPKEIPLTPTTPEKKTAGVYYRIKLGDTLWDLSYVFYRDPWLYPKIAKANNIRDPDFIVAGRSIYIPPR